MLEQWLVLDHRMSLRRDEEEEYSGNKGQLCCRHSSLSRWFPSLLALLGGKVFTVARGLWSNECRKIEREKYKNMMR